MAYAPASQPADSPPETVRIAGVRFRQAGKIYYFDPGTDTFSAGEPVVVETSEGLEMGEVVIPNKQVPIDSVVLPLRPIVRRAQADDQRRLSENRELEARALKLAEERVRAHGLPMKLVSAEVAFDGSRLRFLFVAEKRVDFRVLVKDLAAQFRARIELRQIGVRDQAKIVGGIGDCGRELCCTTWMGDFEPVSIRMAKLQNLSLSPSRLSGQCGRLKCCLKYENDVYRDILKELPKIGAMVGTPHGTGKVVEVLVVKESVLVDLGEGRRVVVKGSELTDPQLPPDTELTEAFNEPGSADPLLGDQVAAGWDLIQPVEEDLLDEEKSLLDDELAQLAGGLDPLEEVAQEVPQFRGPNETGPAVEPGVQRAEDRSSRGSKRRGRRRSARGKAGTEGADVAGSREAGSKEAGLKDGRAEGSKEAHDRTGARSTPGERGGRPGRHRHGQAAEPRPPQAQLAADDEAEDLLAVDVGAAEGGAEHRGAGKRRRRRRRNKGPQVDGEG